MASLNDQIQEMQDVLNIAKQDKTLTPEGQKMLTALSSGQWSQNGLGQFLQGLTLNFSDEAIGSLKSFFTSEPTTVAKGLKTMFPDEPTRTPREVGVAMENVGLKQYATENPLTTIGANIVGGAVPSILSKKPITTSIPAQMGLASVAGATAGIGESEADLFSPESMKSGGIGGAIGFASLPVAKVIGMGTGAVYRGVVNSMFNNPVRLGTDEARTLIKQALSSDVGGVDEAIKFVLAQKGKPYTLADIGPNTRAYLDAANTIPGPGKQQAQTFLENRDKGLLNRLTTDLQVAFGSKAAYFDEFNALKEARKTLGGKLYERALSKDVAVTPELTALMERPSIQNAYARAIELAKEQGIKLPAVSIKDGQLVTANGSVVKDINTTFLHYMKMGLDDLVYTGKSPTSGIGNTQLNAIKDTRNSFLDLIDSSNSTYKNARKAWAGDTAALDAMEEGRTAFNKSAKDIDILLNDMKTMTRSETEALRLGVMQNLLDRMGGAQTAATIVGPTGNPALKILQDTKNMRIIRATFPTDDAGETAFSNFIKNLKTEVQMKSTSKQVLQGSQTAERQQAIQDVRAGGQAVRELPAMSVQGILTRALQRDYQQLGDAQTRAVADEMTRILTTVDPNKLQKISKELAGRSVYDVVSKDIPELLPALGRAVIGPYSIGSQAGNIAPNVGRATGLFSQ